MSRSIQRSFTGSSHDTDRARQSQRGADSRAKHRIFTLGKHLPTLRKPIIAIFLSLGGMFVVVKNVHSIQHIKVLFCNEIKLLPHFAQHDEH